MKSIFFERQLVPPIFLSKFVKIGYKEGLAGVLRHVSFVIFLYRAEGLVKGLLIDFSGLFGPIDLSFHLACQLFNVVSSKVACTLSVDTCPAFLKGSLDLSLELLRTDLFDLRQYKLPVFRRILVQSRWTEWEWSHFV